MRFSLASAFAAFSALTATASAQYCSQLVRPVGGQFATSEFGSTVELGATWAHISDAAPVSSGLPGAGRLNVYSRAPIAGSTVGGHLLFEAQLQASNSQPDDGFGLTSDRSDGDLVVGAPRHDGAGVDSGAVYLFNRVGGQWTETLKVAVPVGAGGGDEFGKHVAIDGNWMAIAAPGRNRIYLYLRSGGAWSLRQTIVPAGSQQAGMTAVEFEGGRLAVCGRRAGGVFELDAATQTWSQTLPFATASSFALTGMDLAQNRLVIARNNGLMDLYDRDPQTGSWSPSILAQQDASSVAIVGDRILVATGVISGGLVNLLSQSGGGSSWTLEDSIPGVLLNPDSLATDGESVLVARSIVGVTDAPTLYDLDCGSIGESSCVQFELNSTGFAGRIDAVGSDLVTDNNVTLQASVLPQDAFGFFIVSQTPASVPGTPAPVCLAGAVGRYVGPGEIQNTDAAGTLSLLIDLTAMPSPTGFLTAAPGDTWYFQCWHRDDPSVGGYGFTDAVRIDLR